MTTKIDQLISTLPDDLQPLARQYADLNIDSLTTQVYAIIELLIDNKRGEAFRLAVREMETADVLIMLEAINERLAELNAAKAAYTDTVSDLLRQAVKIGISILLVKVNG